MYEKAGDYSKRYNDQLSILEKQAEESEKDEESTQEGDNEDHEGGNAERKRGQYQAPHVILEGGDDEKEEPEIENQIQKLKKKSDDKINKAIEDLKTKATSELNEKIDEIKRQNLKGAAKNKAISKLQSNC